MAEHLNHLTGPATSTPGQQRNSLSVGPRGNGANLELLPRVSSYVGIDNVRATELLRLGESFIRWKFKHGLLERHPEERPCRISVDDQLRTVLIQYTGKSKMDRIGAARITGVCINAFNEDVKKLNLPESHFFTLVHLPKNKSKPKRMFFQCTSTQLASIWVVAIKWLLETHAMVKLGKTYTHPSAPTPHDRNHEKKKTLLKAGHVFRMYRNGHNRPCDVTLKCSGNLDHIVWEFKNATSKTGVETHHQSTNHLHKVLVGEKSALFGLAKWCFTLSFNIPPANSSFLNKPERKEFHLAAEDPVTLREWTKLLTWLHETHSGVSMPMQVKKGARLTTDMNWEGLSVTLGRKIGSGGFCEVFEATHVGGRKMALKVFDFDAEIKREIETMKKLNHESIVSYYGCTQDQSKGKMYLLIEFCEGGSVDDLLKRAKEPLKEVHIAFILRSVLEALKYLHSQGVIHRDIKAANILLTLSGKVKLTDFGISEKTSMEGEDYKGTIAGSPLFMSPEDLRAGPPTEKTDVWSLGITALQLAFRKPPHSELRDVLEIFRAVNKNDAPTLESARPPGHSKTFSPEFADFISKCLVKEASTRAGIEELLAHPWMDLPPAKSEYWHILCDQLESYIQHNGVYTYAQKLLPDDSVEALRKHIANRNAGLDVAPSENLGRKYRFMLTLASTSLGDAVPALRKDPMAAGASSAYPTLEDSRLSDSNSGASTVSSTVSTTANLVGDEEEEPEDFWEALAALGKEKEKKDKEGAKAPPAVLKRQQNNQQRAFQNRRSKAWPFFGNNKPDDDILKGRTAVSPKQTKGKKRVSEKDKNRRGSMFGKPGEFVSSLKSQDLRTGALISLDQVSKEMAKWDHEQGNDQMTTDGSFSANTAEISISRDGEEGEQSEDSLSISTKSTGSVPSSVSSFGGGLLSIVRKRRASFSSPDSASSTSAPPFKSTVEPSSLSKAAISPRTAPSRGLDLPSAAESPPSQTRTAPRSRISVGIQLGGDSDDDSDDSDDEDGIDLSKGRGRLNLGSSDDVMKTYEFKQDAFELRRAGGKGTIKVSVTGVSGDNNLTMMIKKEDLRQMQAIGRGQHGTVYKALHLPTLECVAMKTMNAFAQDARHQMLRELEAYSSLSSAQIVNFLGAFFDQGKIVIASEFMDNGSMDGFMKHKCPNGMPEHIVRHLSWQAVKGLEYLHDNKKVHRDIKPDNILLNGKGEAKIGDFGLLTETQDRGTNNLETFVGTMRYLAPERLNSDKYGAPSDVWAMGLTIMYMCTGQEVNASTDFWEVKEEVEGGGTSPSLDKTKFSPALCDFVDKFLIREPEKRWKAKQLLEHEFLKPIQDKKKAEEAAAKRAQQVATTAAARAVSKPDGGAPEVPVRVASFTVDEVGTNKVGESKAGEAAAAASSKASSEPTTSSKESGEAVALLEAAPTSAKVSEVDSSGHSSVVLPSDEDIVAYFRVDRSQDVDIVVDILLEGIYDLEHKEVWQRLAESFQTPVQDIYAAFLRAMNKVTQEASSQGLMAAGADKQREEEKPKTSQAKGEGAPSPKTETTRKDRINIGAT
eukprot:gb/GEZN01000363.1/.p1 GENE.gb/GEZN01000363.1/~~gb/GEZN01000363.1/.p1  ORF type:complete len:1551 (-),score=263.08 gb/GEZN01000363.1/:41-4693(-)